MTAGYRRLNATGKGPIQKNQDLVSAKVLNLEVQGVKQLPFKAPGLKEENKSTTNFINENRRLQSAHISKKSSITATNLTSVLKQQQQEKEARER